MKTQQPKNAWDKGKAVLREKFIASYVYLKKEKKKAHKQSNFTLKTLKKSPKSPKL